jgi:hypothetical protein
MIALLGECSQSWVTGHDVLNIPDDIVDELRDIVTCPERADLGCQEIHLIDNILGVHDADGRISRSIQIVQGSAVNQSLKLGLDGRDLMDKQILVLRGDPALQLIGYRIVKRTNLRESHLLSHAVYPFFCWSSGQSLAPCKTNGSVAFLDCNLDWVGGGVAESGAYIRNARRFCRVAMDVFP